MEQQGRGRWAGGYGMSVVKGEWSSRVEQGMTPEILEGPVKSSDGQLGSSPKRVGEGRMLALCMVF